MGGVTTLLYASTDQDFAGIVVDSPFSNLKQLALEIADQKISLPKFLLEGLLSIINNSIEERAGFRLDQIDVTKVVGKIDVPAVFVTSPDDKLIKQDHPKKLQSLYKGPSQLKIINGDHNAERNIQYKIFVAEFFNEQFKIYLEKKRLLEKKNEIPQQIQEFKEVEQAQKQVQESRMERSISSNSIGIQQGIIQNYGGANTPNIQVGQNQNLNTTSSSAASSLDSNPIPISTGFTIIDTLKDAPQQTLSNTNSQTNLFNKSYSLNNNSGKKELNKIEQIQNYNNYYQIDQKDKNVPKREGEIQDGNISARGGRAQHQKSASISKIPEGVYFNTKTQEVSKFQQESKGRTNSEVSQELLSKQLNNGIQNQQNNNFDELNTSTSREIPKSYYFNQNDQSNPYQNSQKGAQNSNYYTNNNTNNSKSSIHEDTNKSKEIIKQKNDDFSTKSFFKTYDSIRQQKVNKSPSKKISPKNERTEKSQKYININEIIGGNKPQFNTVSVLNTSDVDTSRRKSSENKTNSTNTNSLTEFERFERQNNETEKQFNDNYEENIRQHQKKVAINKYMKKRDSTLDIGDNRDQRLSTLQSVNDEFQEFEYVNLNDLKDEFTPSSKHSQINNSKKKAENFRTLQQQYQISQTGNQRQNTSSGNNQSSLPPTNRTNNIQVNTYHPVSSFSKQNQQQQPQISTNLLDSGQNQPAYVLKSPRIDEKDVNQNKKIKDDKQNISNLQGEQQKIEIGQQASLKSLSNQNDGYSQNFGYEKSRVASTASASNLNQNQDINNINKSNTQTFINQNLTQQDGHYYSSSYNEFGMSRKRNIIVEQLKTLDSKIQTDDSVNQRENITSQNFQKNSIDQNRQKVSQETKYTQNNQQFDLTSNSAKNGFLIAEITTKTPNCVPSLTALEPTSLNNIENDNNPSEKKIKEHTILKSNSTPYIPEASYFRSSKNSDDEINTFERGQNLKSTNSMKSFNFDYAQNDQNANQVISNTVPTQMTTSNSTSNMFASNNYNMTSNQPSHHFNLNLIKQQSNDSQYNYVLDIQASVKLNDKNNLLNNQKDNNRIDFNSSSRDAHLYQLPTTNQDTFARTQTLKNSKVEAAKVHRYYASMDPSPTSAITKQNTQINKVQFQIVDKYDDILEGGDHDANKIQKSARARDASLPLPSKSNYDMIDYLSGSGGNMLQSTNLAQDTNNPKTISSFNNYHVPYNMNSNNMTSHLKNNTNQNINNYNFNKNISNSNEDYNNQQMNSYNEKYYNGNAIQNNMNYQNMYSSVSQEYTLPQTQSTGSLTAIGQLSNNSKVPPLPPQNYHHIRQQSVHLPPKYQKVSFQQAEPNQIINQQNNSNNTHQRSLYKHQTHHQHTSSTPLIQSIHSVQQASDNHQLNTSINANLVNQKSENLIKDQYSSPPHTSNSTHSNAPISNQISGRSQTNSYHHYIQTNKPQSLDFSQLQGNNPDYLNSLSSKSQFYQVKQEQTSILIDDQNLNPIQKNNSQETNSSTSSNRINNTTNQNNYILNMYGQKNYPSSNINQNQITKERYPIIAQESDDSPRKKESKMDIANKEQQQAYEVSSPLNLKRQHNAMAEQCNNRSNLLKEQINYKLNNMQDQFLFYDQSQASSNQTKLYDNQIHLQFKPNSGQNNDFQYSPSKAQIGKIQDVKQLSGNHLTQNPNLNVYLNQNKSNLNMKETSSNQQQNSVIDQINNNNLSTRSKTNSGSTGIPYSSEYTTPSNIQNLVSQTQSHQQQPHHTKSYTQIDRPNSKYEFNTNQYDNSINTSQESQLKLQNSQLTTQQNSYSASLSSQQYTPQYSQKISSYSGNASTADAVSKFKHFTSNNNYRSQIDNAKMNLNFQYGLPQKQQQQQEQSQQANASNNTQIKDNYGSNIQTMSQNKY